MNNNLQSKEKIKVCMYRNFDDEDDFQEIELDVELVGEYIYRQEKLYWKLDPDEHSIADMMYLLALKNDYLYDKIIEECHDLIDNINYNE